MSQKLMSEAAAKALLSQGISLHGINLINTSSVNAGGNISLQFTSSKDSMSVLVPDQGNLMRRACYGEYALQLKIWFAAVQANCWAIVNALGQRRPPKIFLVTEQILAKAYAIGHEQKRSITCSVSVEANVEVPTVLKGEVLTGYTLGRVTVSGGFPKNRPPSADNSLYSLFYKTVEAPPITILGKAPIERLVKIHAYPSLMFRTKM